MGQMPFEMPMRCFTGSMITTDHQVMMMVGCMSTKATELKIDFHRRWLKYLRRSKKILHHQPPQQDRWKS